MSAACPRVHNPSCTALQPRRAAAFHRLQALQRPRARGARRAIESRTAHRARSELRRERPAEDPAPARCALPAASPAAGWRRPPSSSLPLTARIDRWPLDCCCHARCAMLDSIPS